MTYTSCWYQCWVRNALPYTHHNQSCLRWWIDDPACMECKRQRYSRIGENQPGTACKKGNLELLRICLDCRHCTSHSRCHLGFDQRGNMYIGKIPLDWSTFPHRTFCILWFLSHFQSTFLRCMMCRALSCLGHSTTNLEHRAHTHAGGQPHL